MTVSTVSAICSRYSRRNVVRYLRINSLIRPFENLVDDNKIAFLAEVDVSYLLEEEQKTVYKVIDKRYDKNIIRVPRQKMNFLREGLKIAGLRVD